VGVGAAHNGELGAVRCCLSVVAGGARWRARCSAQLVASSARAGVEAACSGEVGAVRRCRPVLSP
jgi:hypothetical protein